MKERPILFSSEMVKAILDGRKTQTRRAIRDQEGVEPMLDSPNKGNWVHRDTLHPCDYTCTGEPFELCPYGKVGDRLWVREKWRVGSTESRITLEITGVRVERLQDISGGDVVAEGVFQQTPRNSHRSEVVDRNYLCSIFHDRWDAINGKKHPWASNPWVWVVEFKKI